MSEASAQAEVVRRFYGAFNDQDLDGFVATLHPDAELQTARGLRSGRIEAREWATKTPVGSLDQRLVLEQVRERGNHAVALYRKQWWWRETDRLAREDEMAAMFTFEDGLISRWQPYEDRSAALALLDELAAT
ncbi:MAG: nuclear transport factor 2 family protein [Solirubrobacterales bacterium]